MPEPQSDTALRNLVLEAYRYSRLGIVSVRRIRIVGRLRSKSDGAAANAALRDLSQLPVLCDRLESLLSQIGPAISGSEASALTVAEVNETTPFHVVLGLARNTYDAVRRAVHIGEGDGFDISETDLPEVLAAIGQLSFITIADEQRVLRKLEEQGALLIGPEVKRKASPKRAPIPVRSTVRRKRSARPKRRPAKSHPVGIPVEDLELNHEDYVARRGDRSIDLQGAPQQWRLLAFLCANPDSCRSFKELGKAMEARTTADVIWVHKLKLEHRLRHGLGVTIGRGPQGGYQLEAIDDAE